MIGYTNIYIWHKFWVATMLITSVINEHKTFWRATVSERSHWHMVCRNLPPNWLEIHRDTRQRKYGNWLIQHIKVQLITRFRWAVTITALVMLIYRFSHPQRHLWMAHTRQLKCAPSEWQNTWRQADIHVDVHVGKYLHSRLWSDAIITTVTTFLWPYDHCYTI